MVCQSQIEPVDMDAAASWGGLQSELVETVLSVGNVVLDSHPRDYCSRLTVIQLPKLHLSDEFLVAANSDSSSRV